MVQTYYCTLTITGWTAVQHGQYIDYDLETIPLEIWTDSALGSGDHVYVTLWTSTGSWAGEVIFRLTSPPWYYGVHCGSLIYFPTDLPTTTVKVWRLTVIKSDNIRVQIVCNEKEVLNIVLSYSTCESRWRRDVAKIYLYGTASDYYRPYQGKY